MVIRSARVVLAAGAAGSVTGHLHQGSSLVQVSAQPHRRHSTQAGTDPSSCKIRPVAQTRHG